MELCLDLVEIGREFFVDDYLECKPSTVEVLFSSILVRGSDPVEGCKHLLISHNHTTSSSTAAAGYEFLKRSMRRCATMLSLTWSRSAFGQLQAARKTSVSNYCSTA
ncbi:hypothetical protein MPTK2_4g18150 [Marchantia polymorpha subsp. ruderalis]